MIIAKIDTFPFQPTITKIGLWFAMLSPVIGLIIGLFGAWLIG